MAQSSSAPLRSFSAATCHQTLHVAEAAIQTLLASSSEGGSLRHSISCLPGTKCDILSALCPPLPALTTFLCKVKTHLCLEVYHSIPSFDLQRDPFIVGCPYIHLPLLHLRAGDVCSHGSLAQYCSSAVRSKRRCGHDHHACRG